MKTRLTISLFLIVLICGCNHTSIKTIETEQSIGFQVTDPNASFFDVKERIDYMKTIDDDYVSQSIYLTFAKNYFLDCGYLPDPIDYTLKMPAFYENRKGWHKAYTPLREFEITITELAEAYVTTGKTAYAKCLLTVLDHWAKHNSLMKFDYQGSYKQAWYAVEWTMSCAGLTYSIIRENPELDSEMKQNVEAWINRVVKKQISYPGGPTSSINNHANWRGLQATIAGVVTDDNELFRWGIQKYIMAMHYMTKKGVFTLEMSRGNRSMHYQNFAILPLVYIAEIASRQGYNLYDLEIDGKTLHMAVNFLHEYIQEDNAKTRPSQDRSFIYRRSEINWMEPYNARFKKDWIEQLLTPKRAIKHGWSGGSSTIYFYTIQ